MVSSLLQGHIFFHLQSDPFSNFKGVNEKVPKFWLTYCLVKMAISNTDPNQKDDYHFFSYLDSIFCQDNLFIDEHVPVCRLWLTTSTSCTRRNHILKVKMYPFSALVVALCVLLNTWCDREFVFCRTTYIRIVEAENYKWLSNR